jgi:hypothetical protein
MERISIRKLTTKIAFDKGYRIKDNKAFSPYSKELKFQRANGVSHNYKLINISVSPNDISFFSKRRSIAIPYHFLLAYEKFGEDFFKKNIHIRHLNRDFDDNSWGNIAIGTASENAFDRDELERKIHATKTSWHNRKFSNEQIKQIKIDRNNGLSYTDLVKKYNTSKSTLSYLFNHALYYRFDNLDQVIEYLKHEHNKN